MPKYCNRYIRWSFSHIPSTLPLNSPARSCSSTGQSYMMNRVPKQPDVPTPHNGQFWTACRGSEFEILSLLDHPYLEGSSPSKWTLTGSSIYTVIGTSFLNVSHNKQRENPFDKRWLLPTGTRILSEWGRSGFSINARWRRKRLQRLIPFAGCRSRRPSEWGKHEECYRRASLRYNPFNHGEWYQKSPN